jgi:hypothetical protein
MWRVSPWEMERPSPVSAGDVYRAVTLGHCSLGGEGGENEEDGGKFIVDFLDHCNDIHNI